MATGTGRQAAFTELYQRLYGLVVDYVGWVVAEPDAADRVTRGAFVEAWHRAHYYRATEGGVEGWILAIAHSRIGEAGRMRRQILTAKQVSSTSTLPVDHWIDDSRAGSLFDEHIAAELASLLRPSPTAPNGRRIPQQPAVRLRGAPQANSVDQLL